MSDWYRSLPVSDGKLGRDVRILLHRRGRFLKTRARCGLGLKVCIWCVYVQMSLGMREWGRWWHQIGRWFCVALLAEVAFSRSGSAIIERGRSHMCRHHHIAPCAESKGPDHRGCQGLPLMWLVTLTEPLYAWIKKYSHMYTEKHASNKRGLTTAL